MLSLTLGLALLPLLGAAQFTVDPPSTASPDTIADCTYWVVAEATDTCALISQNWGLTEEQLNAYNPSLVDGCNIVVGNSYCVEQNYGVPVPTTTLATSTTTSTPTPTPTPATLLEACEAEAGGYKRYCPRCLYRCENTEYVSQCFYSTFMNINYNDSQCWQHGGNDCANKAADLVCPGKKE